jgi:hypothetical protein
MDIWRAAGPDIDFLAPDIYFEDFAAWCGKYHRPGNPLFIPEARGGPAGAANAFYAFGQHGAIGFSPFGIDAEEVTPAAERGTMDGTRQSLSSAYATLARLAPLILEKQATGEIAAMVLEGEAQRAARVSLGDYTMTATRSASPPSAEPAPAERASALFLQTGPEEYIVAGSGRLAVTFAANAPGLPIAGIASIDEETLVDGQWIPGRRLNGDENAQGQLLKLTANDSARSTVYRVRLYRYR